MFRARIRSLMLMVLLAVAPMSLAAPPAVVDQVPEGMPMFVALRSLSGLSAKLAALDKALGLNNPQMQNALVFMKAMTGMNAGVDDNGSVGIIMTAIPLPGQPGPQEPPVLVLVPITDYKAFVGNFGVEAGDGSAAQAINIQGEANFVKKSGNYALISQSPDILNAYAAPAAPAKFAELAGKFGGASMEQSDVLIYLDFAKLSPVLQPLVMAGIMQAQQMFANNPALGEQGAMASAMMSIYGDVIQAYLRDAQSAVIGLDLDADGIGLSLGTQFKADSALAKTFANAPAAELSLNRLPNRPYLMASTMNMGSLPMAQWMAGIKDKLPAGNAFGNIMASAAEMLKLAKGEMQSGYFLPAAGAAGPGLSSFFNAVSVVVTDDPAKMLDASKSSMLALNNLELAPGMKYMSSYNENVMQVAGKQVNQYSLKVNLPPEAMQQLGPAAMLLAGDMGGYMVATDSAVVTTSGSDPVLIKEAIEAAGGAGTLDQTSNLTEIRKHLYESRVAETYIGVGSIMNMANMFLTMFAPNATLEVPPNLPPVAASISMDAGGLGMREYIPLPVIVAVKNAITKVMQQGAGGKPASGLSEGPAPAEPQPAAVTEAPEKPMPRPVGDAEAPAKPVKETITVQPRGESESIVTLTDNTFAAQVNGAGKPVLVDFWATWCGPCKTQAPIVADLADAMHEKVAFGKVDVDKNPRTTQLYGIEAIPTLVILKDGKEVARFVGLTPKEKIQTRLAEVLAGK